LARQVAERLRRPADVVQTLLRVVPIRQRRQLPLEDRLALDFYPAMGVNRRRIVLVPAALDQAFRGELVEVSA